MARHGFTPRFRRDYKKLTSEEKSLVSKALTEFEADVDNDRFRLTLRVKKMQGRDVWEMTWSFRNPDGRATWEYGDPVEGETVIVWRRVGKHDIYRNP